MNDNGCDRRMTDEQYDDWLRSVEEAAAEKEDVDLPLNLYDGRPRVQVAINNRQLYGAKNPEGFIRECLIRHKFDLSAPIQRAPIMNQDATMFYGWLKEDDHDDADARADAEYLSRYFQRRSDEISNKISYSDLYEMLTRSGMLRADTFPRSYNSFDTY